MKGCLIAFAIVVVAIVAIVIAVIWFVRDLAKGITNDPQEVVKQLHERYPTAQIPDGYEGKMGMHIKFIFDMHMVILGKDNAEVNEGGHGFSGDLLMLFSVSVPGAKEEDLEKSLAQMNQGGEVIEKHRYTVRAGDYEFEGFKQTMERRAGGERIKSPQILVQLGPSSFVIMQGTDDGVDEAALREFLSSIAKDCPMAKKVGDKKENKELEKQPDKNKKDNQQKGDGEKEKGS
jgi:hypothetical protein